MPESMVRTWLIWSVGICSLGSFGCSVDDRSLQNLDGNVGASNGVDAGGGVGNRADGGAGQSAASAGGAHEANASNGAGRSGSGDAGAGAAPDITSPRAGACPDLDHNGVPDCEESLVKNPSFDADVVGWESEVGASAAWQGKDADDQTGSGSLSVQDINVVEIDGWTTAGAAQCVSVSGGKTYVYYVKAFVNAPHNGAPQAGLNVQFFGSKNCSGEVLANRIAYLPDTAQGWGELVMTAQAFSNAESMLVRLVAVKPFKAPPVTALFDDVLVREQ